MTDPRTRCSGCAEELLPEARHCPSCGLAIGASAVAKTLLSSRPELALEHTLPALAQHPVLATLPASTSPDGPSTGPQAGGPALGSDPWLGATVAGRFVIKRRLGAGGMGSVYLAEQSAVGREVALKVLHPSLSAQDELRERFSREAHAVSQLKSPNTIVLFDFGTSDDERLYMAMEYVEGRTLAELLLEGGALSPMRAIAIALQVLSALAEAHERGIVHRDLKPENLMLVQRAGTADFVKVLDFGIAKIIASQEHAVAPVAVAEQRAAARQLGTSALTQHGEIFGSPRYMAPEQALGEAVSARTDLYALGVILYEMLCGRPPFAADNTLRLLHDHAHTPIPSLAEAFPQLALPEELCQLVASCLEKRPEDRPQSANELAQRLRATTQIVARQRQLEEQALERLVGIRRGTNPRRLLWSLGLPALGLAFGLGVFAGAHTTAPAHATLAAGDRLLVARASQRVPKWLVPTVLSARDGAVGRAFDAPSIAKAVALAEADALSRLLELPLRFGEGEPAQRQLDLQRIAELYRSQPAHALRRVGSYWLKLLVGQGKGSHYRFDGYVRLATPTPALRAQLRRNFAELRYRNASFLLDSAVRHRRCGEAGQLDRIVVGAIAELKEKKAQKRTMQAYLAHQLAPCGLSALAPSATSQPKPASQPAAWTPPR